MTRIEVQTKMSYGNRQEIIGGFEIGPQPKADPTDEISLGGDSGSAWLAADAKTGKPTDVMLGLHFAGEASDDQQEFAMASQRTRCSRNSTLHLHRPPPAPVWQSSNVSSAATVTSRISSALNCPCRWPQPPSAMI